MIDRSASRSASSRSIRSNSSTEDIPRRTARIIFSNHIFFCFRRRSTFASAIRRSSSAFSTASSNSRNCVPIRSNSSLVGPWTSHFGRPARTHSAQRDESRSETWQEEIPRCSHDEHDGISIDEERMARRRAERRSEEDFLDDLTIRLDMVGHG